MKTKTSETVNRVSSISTQARLAGRRAIALALLLLVVSGTATGANFYVGVSGDLHPRYTPPSVTINVGDTVYRDWDESFPAGHSVTSGGRPNGNGLFNSGLQRTGSFSYTFLNAGTYPYFCQNHPNHNGEVIVTAANTTASQPLNISTRLSVQTGENVMIGGFIITGNAPKKVIIRAIGPSLSGAVQGFLADPTLELHDAAGPLASNDNWKTRPDGGSQQAEIEASTIPPGHDLEAAIVAILPANNAHYTAIVRGKNNTTGIAVVETYDLDQAADSKLANISTRGFVQTASNVMIGGFILGGGSGNSTVLVRAIGPSLAQVGINGALANPTLELRDGNGALLKDNDDWKQSPEQAEIQATGIPPQDDLEAALKASLPPGSYTAIVAGKDGGTGIGLVEAYRLQ